MKLPINIEELLNGRAVEGNRLEYKTGWNPDTIYRTICAFANDFDETGGGYIVIGVKEENGRAVRPVIGVSRDQIEPIEREMVGYNNLIQPYYQPRLYIEEIDNKIVLVIKVSSGERRPYKVPCNITNKQKTYNYYIRYNSSSIVPRGEYERELMNLANRTPFDDRGNRIIKLTDISPLLLHDYLVKVKSSLAELSLMSNMEEILEQMDLLEPAPDGMLVKNVAAMMFSEQPNRFFKQAQVDIVIFPEGRENNPNRLIEIEPIKGCVPIMIRDTLNFLRTNIIKKQIIKPKDQAQSKTFYNYPYQALEEAVVNSLYHRDWTIPEPVEITIEPQRISILSFSGPNHTIPIEAVREGKALRSRRYRNRRLGEFLKELDLTEGRATGIPTIQDELYNNGSPSAIIETDQERTFFLIDIPCHLNFVSNEISIYQTNISDDAKGGAKELTDIQYSILKEMQDSPTITTSELAQKLNVKFRTLQRHIALLQSLGKVTRKGGRRRGYWEITTNI